MTDGSRTPQRPEAGESDSATACSAMLARRWAIASCYRDPSAYGVPSLPDWAVRRDSDGLAFAAAEGGEPFIAARNPVSVRR
jgi:hypothetical protein